MQIVGAKIKLIYRFINVFSVYIPPKNKKNGKTIELAFNEFETAFVKMNVNYKPFIITADFNCHSPYWYCSYENHYGSKLNELVNNNRTCIINTNQATHRAEKSNSVIDLMIILSDLCDRFNYFKVKNNDLLSDHFPIVAKFNMRVKRYTKKKEVIKFSSISWLDYQFFIENKIEYANYIQLNDDIESIHDYLNNIIHDAIESSTKIKTKRINAKTLPKYLI